MLDRRRASDQRVPGELSIHPATKAREAKVASLLGHSGTTQVVENIRAAKPDKSRERATTVVTTAMLGVPMLHTVAMPGMRDFVVAESERYELRAPVNVAVVELASNRGR